ncbi:ABC transporter ATP-binding protein [Streptomyces radicis]|uniref:ABC transporter ATP-binding protein n=1 Tax=Streptomyces radicis TaxID=1750517 RepID=A0A3A9VSD2_9ACTN|nr:ABC transporter ATP-binding protein [Streptomyces radicis]RKN03472.1 ABC transporter ATP-binding protein [Streptomyces radicis]RKN13334.1 ABC transporter ATP-binding protein [Streptomyces radicis]
MNAPTDGAAGTAPALVIADVSKSFGDQTRRVPALGKVSLTVARGEFVSLIGPSGCGKSTLINIVAGLIDGYEGRVTVSGAPLDGPHPSIGMVFQDDSTFPWLSTLQNVEFGMRMAGVNATERRERAMEMLDLIGLRSFADRYPAQLSGGMRQRVALARALAMRPEILLMDEPFAALDEQTRMVLGEELLRLQEELQQTVVFVTHNLGEAVQLSDRVVAMTARPASIKAILEVDLPRPRDSSIVSSDRYGELVAHLWSLLREEAITAFNQRDAAQAGAVR